MRHATASQSETSPSAPAPSSQVTSSRVTSLQAASSEAISSQAISSQVISSQVMGRRGEDAAARWYLDHGGTVIDRNWRHGRAGELDLIVEIDNLTVFCEVKARASERFGIPAEAVGWDKQRRIRRLAAAWLQQNPGAGHVRFDVASVVGGSVDVIEAAF